VIQDRFSEILDASRVLMRKGRKEEACRLLAEARDRAASEGQPAEAALYSSVRGSYLVAMGRDSEAQESYRDAERFSNGEASDKLISARHLIYGLKRPEEGLSKAGEVLEATTVGTTVWQEATAIQGIARIAMNQPGEAVNCLKTLLARLRSTQIRASGCDLLLVDELLKQQQAGELCRAYISLAESRAREAQDHEVLARILAIKGAL
jgi:hypothetical protein